MEVKGNLMRLSNFPRRLVGVVAMAAGVGLVIVKDDLTGSAPVPDAGFAMQVLAVWYLLSAANKAVMITNSRSVPLNGLAVVAWLYLMITVRNQSGIAAYPVVPEVMGSPYVVMLIGWPIIDAIDFLVDFISRLPRPPVKQ
jgi:hypothetical protein